MDRRNLLASSLYDWISEGGDPLRLLEAKPDDLKFLLDHTPCYVQRYFIQYYPFHCTRESLAWLKAKCTSWLEGRVDGHMPSFDLYDPIKLEPVEEKILAPRKRKRIRYRKASFNKSNLFFLVLRHMNFFTIEDIKQEGGYTHVLNKIKDWIESDEILFKHVGKIPTGSAHRLLQQNIEGYKAYNPPRNQEMFYEEMKQVYIEAGGERKL